MGHILALTTEKQDQLYWLMSSGDQNGARLLLAVLDDLEGANLHDEVPSLAEGLRQRQRRGHWDTTPANAWGTLAMRRFGAKYEKTPVTGVTEVRIAQGSDGDGPIEGKVEWVTKSRKASAAGSSARIVELAWPKKASELTTKHIGAGDPWMLVESRAALSLKQAVSSGYKVSKTWTAVERKKSGAWTRGDLVRVRLELEAQADMTWVAVSDPIPAGASILGSGLGNDSALATRDEKSAPSAPPYAMEETVPAYEERSFEAYRAYYDFVPKGKWAIEYTLRLNQSGQLGMPPTRVEALYAPEIFAEAPNAALRIEAGESGK